MIINSSFPILCIADVHLCNQNKTNKQIENHLLDLLKWAKEHQYHIVLLGDFFDYWVDIYKYVPPIGERILSFFQNYHQTQNKRSTYLLGNHDYWTSGYFEKIGFEVSTYALLPWQGKKILLMHGDGECSSSFEFSYPFLGQIIRSSYTKKLLKYCLKGEHILAIMRLYSWFSSTFSSPAKKRQENILKTARKMININGINGVLFGHTHIPYIKHYSDGFLANPGAFYKYKMVFILDQEKIGLWKWNSLQKTLSPVEPPKLSSLESILD